MQAKIFRNKNKLMIASGILIASAFLSKWIFKSDGSFEIALIIASVLGTLPIALQAYQALKVKVISIDLLVTIAVIGAFIIKNYEESAIVTFLFLFGAYLEMRTLNKTRSAIKSLTEMVPETALKLMDDGSYVEVDIFDVDIDDQLMIMTGSKVPVDGTVVQGQGSINEASITGEPIPVEKTLDSKVFAGTILENGTLQVKADRVGEDTTFGRIIELIEEAQDSKSEAERFIDRFSKYYTPLVLLVSFIVYLFSKDVELAITILVLGCPGALVIGVPVSNVAGLGNGASHGVLLKGSEVIHDFSRTDTFIFDKTGTLTSGNPEVSDFIDYDNTTQQELDYLASIEKESNHPLAKAIISYLNQEDDYVIDETQVIKGGGIIAKVDKKTIKLGNLGIMRNNHVKLSDQVINDAKRLEDEGNSLVLMAIDGKLKLLLGIKDQIRPGIKADLEALKLLGAKHLIMLSGDNQGSVDLVSKELGLTEAHGNMLPEDKANYVKELKKQGRIVAFIGDGVNDSPSLALSDIGIAMGSGTDVAIETSDVVLMNSDMSRLPHAYGLAQATASNMVQNIAIALLVVLFLLSSLLFTEWMNMSLGMLLHEGSILVVILNGMRLIRYKNKEKGAY